MFVFKKSKNDSITINLRALWKFSFFLYLIFSTIIGSKSYLYMFNSYALYFFLGVSIMCVLVKNEIKFNSLLVSAIAFWIVLIIGTFYSTSSYANEYVYKYFIWICLLFCMINYIEDKDDVLFIFKVLMLAGLIQDLYILSIYGSSFVDVFLEEQRVGRVGGNVNDVGLKSCYSACIALYFILNEKCTKVKKYLYGMLCIICIFFAVITASKKVIILLAFGFVYLFLFRENKQKSIGFVLRNLLIAVGVCAVVALLIYNFEYFSYMRVRIEEFLDFTINDGGNSSDRKRMKFIKGGFEVFLQKPFFGDGTAASYNYFNTYSHSNFVEILMCNGIVGFIAFYFCYPSVFIRGLSKKNKDTSNMDLTSLCLFFFVSIIILSIALVYYIFIYYQVLLTASAIYILYLKDEPKKDLMISDNVI